VVLILVGALGFAGAVVATAQELRRAEATAPHGVSGQVEDVQVIVHHGADRAPSHVYSQYSTTRVQTEGDFLLIEGSLSEAAGQEPATIVIKLRTTPHHDEDDEALYKAQRTPTP
jgi:hypothetical protein